MSKDSGSKPTIIDVSQKAGVSVSTVSRVINGTTGVRPEPRERVLMAIAELGYRPNYSARSLKTQRSFSIFVLVPEIDNPYYTEIYHGARMSLEEKGYMTYLFEATDAEKVLRSVMNRGADGIIMDARYYKQATPILESAGIPYTVYNSPSQLALPGSVCINLYATLLELCSRLYSLNHQRIGYITDRPVKTHAHDRFHALKKAAELAGVPFDEELVCAISSPQDQFDCGYQGLLHLFENKNPPDAVITINDHAAIGAMAGAQKLGLSIPQDLSLVGFDNTAVGIYTNPPLSSVHLPTRIQGETAALMLLDRIADPQFPLPAITLDTEIILRSSVRGIKEGH